MFKRVASEALGLSDIGKVISPEDYDKVESDDYVLHEEGEKIYFLIKSRQDEYCFTNLALIHVDGTSALSKKRVLRRLPYYAHQLSEIFLETAGTMDMDVEIKFRAGDAEYSIDVDKKQLERLKDLYKSLLAISTMQQEGARMLEYARVSIDTAAASIARSTEAEAVKDQFRAVNEYAFAWLQKTHAAYRRKDFGEVFEKFIDN